MQPEESRYDFGLAKMAVYAGFPAALEGVKSAASVFSEKAESA